MARRGRPRKQGPRTKSDRPSRAGQGPDRGTDWVQARKARFGEHYGTALGRAYSDGLLGDGQMAADRFDAAKRFARVYARHIDQDRYRCALDRTPRGALAVAVDLDHLLWEQEQQQWLLDAMAIVDRTGCRPYLDQLIGKQYTDTGPYWLDNLLAGGRHPADIAVLQAALKAIDAITPKRVARIVAVR